MPVRPTVTYNGQAITAESFEVNIRRGRSRELDEFQAVTGVIRVHNYDANFAPPWFTTPAFLLMESGDYLLLENGDRIQLEQGSTASGAYGTIELGGSLVVQDGAVTVFTGHLEDVNVLYDASGRATAELVCGDALTSLASTQFSENYVPADHQRSSARITSVLARSDVGLSGSVGTIDTGSIHVTGGTTETVDGVEVISGHFASAGSNVLQYLQTVARTEFGKFYVDASGDLQFRSRFSFPSSTPSASFSDVPDAALPFAQVSVAFGSEQRSWRASVQREGGVAQFADAGTSPPAALGERTLALTGLLFRDDMYSQSLATYLANRYSEPEAFVDELVVPLARLSTSNRATVCGLDIHDTVSLTWTPTGGSQIIQTLVVEGVTYRSDERGEATLTLQVSAYPNTNYLLLDTDSYDAGIPYGF